MTSVLLRFTVFATLLALAGDVRAQNLSSGESSEHLIKAGYVYNFAKLVEWPASVAPKGQPIVIAVLGNDEFATVLSRVVDGKKIDDRVFTVKRLKGKDLKECGCRILFVASSESARTEEIVQFQNAASVLTIAEVPDFARRGGIISLTLEDSKVRFAINVDAAAQASLTISSRLLTLATIVHAAR
jgi:hypothetical protein